MPGKVVVAVITRRGRVLLVRRRRPEGPLAWAFPGGAVEPGETEAEAVEREVREEVGLHVRADAKLGERAHPDTGRVIAYWSCEPVSGEGAIADAEELDESRWATAAEAFELITSDLFPPVREHLQQHA